MKLLVVASSLDLTAPLSSTPSWWQLLKALAEAGVELVVAPYQGPAIESPWWSAAANPCQVEGDAVSLLKRIGPPRRPSLSTGTEPSRGDRLTLELVARVTRPRWRAHLRRLIRDYRGFDAALFLTVPPNHFQGIPAELERDFGLPTHFYDGDVPASLPRFAGFQTGFRIYPGADLAEYATVISSSAGGVEDLRQLGARRVEVLYYGADPTLFDQPAAVQDIDVFFYGHGREYREAWIDAMLVEPSRQLPAVRFAVRGTRLRVPPEIRSLPYASFARLGDYCRRSRINLLITRQAHTSVDRSSTARPFELAAMGCAMVTNPYLGIEAWFEPGREVLVLHDPAEAVAMYRELLANDTLRSELGRRARQRLLAEHTYRHRARQLLDILQSD